MILPCEKKTHGKNKTHGKWWEFAVCHDEHTATWFVCRVPNVWHTANRWPRRAVCLTVGFAVRFNWHTAIKIYAVCFCSFAVCLSCGTRQIVLKKLIKHS